MMNIEIKVPISPGELIDKITILRIKSQRMSDPQKLHNVQARTRGAARHVVELGVMPESISRPISMP